MGVQDLRPGVVGVAFIHNAAGNVARVFTELQLVLIFEVNHILLHASGLLLELMDILVGTAVAKAGFEILLLVE